MAEDNKRTAAAKRQRVQRLKKCIILSAVAVIMLPIVLCFILLDRIQNTDKTLDNLIMQVETLTGIVREQRQQLEELKGLTAVSGESGANDIFAGSDNGEYRQPGQESGLASGGEADSESGSDEEITGRPGDRNEPEETGESEEEITAAHKVYLTFDDGPSKYTNDILDILDSYGVKATFFVVGKESDSAREAMQEIVDRGHTLGMHSYSHKYSEIYKSVEDFAGDYEKIRDYVYEVTGVESKVYRFPGGSSNSVSHLSMEEFADYLDTQEVRFFDWNISSGDGGATLLSAETLVENCTADIERFETSVILMHDSASKPTTVEALPTIIENILALEDTVILPITEDTELVQHIQRRPETPGDQ